MPPSGSGSLLVNQMMRRVVFSWTWKEESSSGRRKRNCSIAQRNSAIGCCISAIPGWTGMPTPCENASSWKSRPGVIPYWEAHSRVIGMRSFSVTKILRGGSGAAKKFRPNSAKSAARSLKLRLKIRSDRRIAPAAMHSS